MIQKNEEKLEKNVQELRKAYEAAIKRTEKEKEEEKEFKSIVKEFNQYYELTEEFCKPFMSDKDKTDREKELKKVTEYFKKLEEFYENPEELLDEFYQPLDTQYDLPLGGLYEKDKEEYEAKQKKSASPSFMRKELESCLFDTLKLWMLAEKAQRYNHVLSAVCIDTSILEYSDSCRSKDVEGNEQSILPLWGDRNYKREEYLSKVESIKKLREELAKKIVLLEQKSWRDAVLFWFQNSKFSRELFKEIEGSANSVVEIGEEVFLSTHPIIIKMSEKGSSSLKSEKEVIDYLHKETWKKWGDFFSLDMMYNSDFYNFPSEYSFLSGIVSLPKIAFFYELENLEILAMHNKHQWGIEMTKSKLDDESKEKCLGTIANFLAHIHKKIPLNKSEKGIVDIADYINKRLDNPFLELKDDIKLKISENLTPVLECLVNAPYAIYKDAHPDNFLVDDGHGVTVLDWEDKGFHPIYFDLVNFCEYSRFITCKEKKKWLKYYVQAYNSNENNKDGPKLEYNSDFYLSYLNAVIYRSICFSSAWSNPDRGEYKKSRINMLNKAVGAIGVIKNNHTPYYNKYKNNYDSLEKTIKEAITELDLESDLFYLNTIIYHPIYLSSKWKKYDRKNYGKTMITMINMLNKAVGAIGIIKNNHTPYYNRYKNKYDSLEKTIKEAIIQLS